MKETAQFTAYLRKKGRITIPKKVRDALDIKDGNLVKCEIKNV